MKRTATYCFSLLMVIGLTAATAQQRENSVSFRFSGLTLRASLDSLMKWFPVSIVYLDRDVEGETVTAGCSGCDFEGALNSILQETSLTWLRTGNQVVLQKRPSVLPRPSGSVSGVVMDSASGELLSGLTVLLLDSARQTPRKVRHWCATNSSGFFSLRGVPPGEYILNVRGMGYRPARIPVALSAGEAIRQDIELSEENITLQEVMVEGRRTALASAQGFTRGLYVRSTPSDQTEYLIDGARVYSPNHFGGLLSTFNGEVVNDVQVVVGGLPPYYGGQIGGILDLSMRDGTLGKFSGSAGVGSLDTYLSLEGPLAEQTSFLLSGRRGFPEPAVPFLADYGTPGRQGLTEVTGRVTHRIAPGEQIFVNGHVGIDSYDNAVQGSGVALSNNFRWANSAFSLGWNAIASPSLFLRASGFFSRYDFSLEHGFTGGTAMPPPTGLSSDYAIEDVSLRAHAEHYYDQEHTLRGGVELIHHRTNGYLSEFSTRTGHMSLDGLSMWELSVYLQDQWRLLPGLTADIGARATTFSGSRGTFSSVDPRFSLLAALTDQVRLYGSMTSVNQYLHPYRTTGVFLLYPTTFWYPSTELMKPSTSIQFTLGAEAGDDTYRASIESYFRSTSNLHGYGIDPSLGARAALDSSVLLGSGRAYGLQLSAQKRTGDFSGSVMYTLSWFTEQFAEVNGGEPFSPRLDRRHELQVSLSYMPGEEWILGLLGVVASGASPVLEPPVLNAGRDDAMASLPVDVNGSRLPGFQRVELSVSRRLMLTRLECLVSLRLLNSYGLVDPYVWKIRNVSDPRLMWSASLDDLKLFPLFPTLDIVVRF